MIFIGDIACPKEKADRFIDGIRQLDVFKGDIVVLNLEANILLDTDERKDITLWNTTRTIEAFSGARKVIVSLANNHMYDYPEHILRTRDLLQKNNVGVFGLTESDGTFLPYEYKDENGTKYAFFGHCWRLYTKTNPNKVNDIRIVDLPYAEFAEKVREYIVKNPQVKVYCMMHWNYDLEKLPFPMLRSISRKLIDYGVEGVIGSHSHRPQGAEIYKGKPIVYCLGNFYLPSGYFFNGNLNYPECCHRTYGLQIKGEQTNIVWFETDKEDPIRLINNEQIGKGQQIIILSPFASMDKNEYLKYFKTNRQKKMLVPVFDSYEGLSYQYKEKFAVGRVKILKRLLKLLKR